MTMDRRGFLTRVAGVLALATVAPARLLDARALAPASPPLAFAPDGLRNVVRVAYVDLATGEQRMVEAHDVESVARYGPRVMRLDYPPRTAIDTEAEARRIADHIVADLSRI